MTTAVGAAADQASSTITAFSVSDTAANIATYFNSLNGDTKLTAITASDGNPIAITYTQFTTDTYALKVLASGTYVSVSAVPVADASTVQASAVVKSFSVTDTSADVLAGLATLAAASKLSSIVLSGTTTLAVTYAQYSSYTTTLDKLASGNTMTVSAATAAAASTLQSDTHVASFTVSDTSANIATSLSTLNTATKLTSIALSSGSTLSITYSQYTADTTALGKLATGIGLVLSAVTVANAAAVQSAAKVTSFSVTDTSANIVAGAASLAADTKLTAISLSSGTALSLTYAQYTADTAVIALLASGETVTVSGATVANAAALQSAAKVGSFSVTDTAANVLAGVASLAADSKLSSISLSSTTPLVVTYSQYSSYTSTLDKLASGYTMTVSGATAAAAATLQADSHVGTFTVSDTGANIAASLSTLNTATKLTSIALSSGTTLPITYAQYTADTTALGHLASGITLTVSAATVANAATLQSASKVSAFSVTDTSADIAANLTTLAADTKLTGLVLSGGTVLAISDAQYTADAALLALLSTADSMTVSAAPAAAAGALQAAANVSGFGVTDTSANIAANLGSLAADSKLTALVLSGGTVLSITDAQYTADTAPLKLLSSSDSLAVSAAAAGAGAALQAASNVSAFSVSDTSTNILANLGTLATESKLSSFSLTDTTTLQVTATQYFADTTTLDKIAAPDSLVVSGATAAEASTLQADSHVSAFSVSDTAANLSADASALAADTKLTSETTIVTSGQPETVTYAQYVANTASLDASAGTGGLIVTGTPAADAATVAADTAVKTLTVSDTLADVGTYLGSLQTLVTSGQLTGIAVTDSGQNLNITAAQSTADAGALAMMTGTFTVTRPVINLIFDSSVANAPAGWVGAVEDAANYLDALITNPVTINIDIGYGEVNGTTIPATDVAQSEALGGTGMTASTFLTDLATSTNDQTILGDISTVAATAPSQTMEVVDGEAKALGAVAAYGTEADGATGFQTDPTGTDYAYNPYDRAVPGAVDMIGLAEAELTHDLGRLSYSGVTVPLDLYRYASDGVQTASGNTSYFSVNGGQTNLDNFATSVDTSDWSATAVADANDASPAADTVNLFSQTDVTEMAALGFSIAANQPNAAGVIPAWAANGLNQTSLTFIGSPQTITMGGTVTTASTAIPPSTGIEEIAGFTYGTDTLTVSLSDLSGTLEAFDTTVNGTHAIALAGSNDLTNGIVLTGMPTADTAANLLSSHLTIAGTTATIS